MECLSITIPCDITLNVGLKEIPTVLVRLGVSSSQIMYRFFIEFLKLAVSCLGLGDDGCNCTALTIH